MWAIHKTKLSYVQIFSPVTAQNRCVTTNKQPLKHARRARTKYVPEALTKSRFGYIFTTKEKEIICMREKTAQETTRTKHLTANVLPTMFLPHGILYTTSATLPSVCGRRKTTFAVKRTVNSVYIHVCPFSQVFEGKFGCELNCTWSFCQRRKCYALQIILGLTIKLFRIFSVK